MALEPSVARSPSPSFAVRSPRLRLIPAGEDPNRGIPRDWWGGDLFRSHFADALSSTFPLGEAFFVRSVRRYADRIEDPVLQAEIRAFVGQEAQHGRLHDEHVALLIGQGYTAIATRNRVADRVMRWHNRRTPRLSLASTAALEHLTSILARQLLEDERGWTLDMHPDMRRLWRWHALEETEHKAVAFDVLMAVAPGRGLRAFAMAINTGGLLIEVIDRMAYMLWKDGRCLDFRLWRDGFRFLFGRGGFLRGVGSAYRAWYGREFHPTDIDDGRMIARHAPRIEAEIGAEVVR